MLVEVSEPSPLYMDYVGTSFAGGEPSFTFASRLSRCYELAAYAVAWGDLSHGTLVHGSFHGPTGERRIGHAWVTFQEDAGEPLRVWEPITGRVYDRVEWYAWVKAREERTYDKEQTIVRLLADGHWGRWHESEWP